MITLDAYTNDQHGQVLEAYCIDAKPADLKELGDFPETPYSWDYSKPLTILADHDWLIAHLVAYAITDGYEHIRVSKITPLNAICIYDSEHFKNEGDEYNILTN